MLTLRRARFAFKIAAAFARAVPFWSLAAASVDLDLTTGFLTGAFAGFLAGADFFATGFPSFPLAAGFFSPVFLATGFLSVAFFAGAAFFSVDFAAGFLVAAEAAGFFSAALAAGFAAFFSATTGLDSVAGRFGAAAGFLAGSVDFLAAPDDVAAAAGFAVSFLGAAGFLSLSDSPAKRIEMRKNDFSFFLG